MERRRGDPNQLGFALQLCALRYPGRLLRSEEAIPVPALRFVADQLGVAPGSLTAYAARALAPRHGVSNSTRYGRRSVLPCSLHSTNASC